MSWLFALALSAVLSQDVPPPRPKEPPPIDPAKKEPPPTQDDIQKILDEVKKKADANAQTDRDKAEGFMEKAKRAFEAGELTDAAQLIRKAQRLDPESATIRRLALHYGRLADEAGDRNANLNLARARLDEALAHAKKLNANDPDQAKAFAQAVLDSAVRFPQRFDLATQTEEAHQLLGPVQAPPPPGAAEPPVAPREAAPTPSKPIDTKQALKTRLSVSWLQVPLVQALSELSDATGVTFIIDPQLARLRWFETRYISYEAKDAAANKLLQEILDVAGMDAVPGKEGKALLTTKQQALAFAVAKSRDTQDGPRGFGPPASPPARAPIRSVSPRTSEQKATDALARRPTDPPPLPDYLRTPRALQLSLDEFLGPVLKAEPEKPIRPPD